MANIVKKTEMDGFRAFLDKYKGHLDKFATRNLDSEAIFKYMEQAVTKVPQLLDCTKLSILNFVMAAKELQLRPGGARPQIHPVPFYSSKLQKTICTPIIDYRGMVAICERNNPGMKFKAQVVFEHDAFDWNEGTNPYIIHKPLVSGDRGEMIGVYGLIFPPDGGQVQFKYLRADQVMKIKNSSKAKDSGPWVDWEPEMWEKTAIKKVANLNEGNEEVQKALDIDDKGETGTPIYDLEIEEEPKEEKRTATQKLSEKIGRKTATDSIKTIENLQKDTKPKELEDLERQPREPGDEPEIPSHVGPTQGDLDD